jgi:uncharacterized protein
LKRFPVILIVLLLAFSVSAVSQEKVPALAGRVNDYAKLLDARQTQQLEEALARFEQETTTQIVLLTVPSLGGETIEQFGIRVGEAWKIGQKGRDNGAILIVAPKERRVRIEVGYGLEGSLTDARSAEIIRNVILPAFKEGQYFAGIAGGLDAMMKTTQGEYKAAQRQPVYERQRTGKASSTLSTLFMIVIFILLISTRTGRLILFTTMLFGGHGGGRGGSSGGGGFSGGGGGFGGGGASGSW